MLLTANWRDWYHFRHQQECFKSGSAFEDYVSAVLNRFHDDFVNPDPSGTLGDGGVRRPGRVGNDLLRLLRSATRTER